MNSKIAAIIARKGHTPVSELTAYDYPTARLVDEAGVDMILVGDSLGMVMLGYPDTTHVTLAHMLHHVEAVARAAQHAVVIADMPIHTYDTPEQALATAHALMAVGADAVKLEGGAAMEAQIRAITQAGIPVQGHIGLLPQKVREDGGYRMRGKTDEEAAALMRDMEAVVRAGAFSVVIECTKHSVAKAITEACPIITIGIGAGRGTCDGEVAVFHDLVGGYPWFTPSFARPKANIAGEITRAVKEYIAEVRQPE
ncbi:MAG: 3-methyl-2-oxobutanoate hydroxymethyltransferase [Akkermansia sp.]|nr:3-methyl-2-oxobutanoate hydroxymethyltransferase [Akkermansia sp.]